MGFIVDATMGKKAILGMQRMHTTQRQTYQIHIHEESATLRRLQSWFLPLRDQVWASDLVR